MVDVSSAIIQIQQQIIESQGAGNIFKACIPTLTGVFVGVFITYIKDSIDWIRKKNKIKRSVKTEFKQEVKYLKKCITTAYLTIKNWSEYYNYFEKVEENVPKIIYAKVHSFLAFEKYKIDYYNISNDVRKEYLKRVIVDYESLNDTVLILNEHYMVCKKGDAQNKTVSGVNNYNNYLHCLIEYLNALVVFVCQIERTLYNKVEEDSGIYTTISEEEFCSVGVIKNDLDKMILSINEYYSKVLNIIKMNNICYSYTSIL